MAKRVATDMKIEVKNWTAGEDEWQDISDHVQRVEIDYDVGEVVKVILTIQADKDGLRINGGAPWEGDGIQRAGQAAYDKRNPRG